MISLLASAIARRIFFDHQKSCKGGTQSLDRENDQVAVAFVRKVHYQAETVAYLYMHHPVHNR